MSSPRALEIPLVLAERYWAAAMATKRGDLQASWGEVRRGRDVRKKLGRAVESAERLREIVAEVGDEGSVFEAEGYAAWMGATRDLEMEEWARALAGFERVQRVYEGVVALCEGSAAGGVFEERLDEVATAVRFCRYNLARGEGGGGEVEALKGGVADDVLAQKIEGVLKEARRKEAEDLAEVTWCGQAVPLRTAGVREAVMVAQQRSEGLKVDAEAQKNVDAYDDVFIAYNDASSVVARAIKEFRDAAAGRSEERIAELELVAAYLAYGRLSHTIDRNALLVESVRVRKGSRAEDLVRLYDNMIGNVTDMIGLDGADGDAAFITASENRRTGFRAQRCFHLAECYRVAGRLAEAAALYGHVGTLAGGLKSGDITRDGELSKVVAASRGMRCRLRADEFIKTAGTAAELSALSLSSVPNGVGVHAVMTDHLDAFVSFAGDKSGARSIGDVPPRLEAVPCKPVMFDLAIDGIVFPEAPSAERAAAPDATAGQKEDATGSGKATGYLSRWFSAK